MDYPVQGEDESDEDFTIRVYQYIRGQIIEALKGTDLYIMEDYPFCYGYEYDESQEENQDLYEMIRRYNCYLPACVVIGSIEELKELCEFGQAINGLYLHFASALRPDLVEVFLENGYKSENANEVLYSVERYKEVFGEETCVPITVEVKHWR